MRGHGIWCWLVWWSKAMTKFTECIWVFLGWSDIAKRWPALYGAGMVCDLIQSILIPMLSSFYHCFHSIKRILRSFQPQCGSHNGRGKKVHALHGWHRVIFILQKDGAEINDASKILYSYSNVLRDKHDGQNLSCTLLKSRCQAWKDKDCSFLVACSK